MSLVLPVERLEPEKAIVGAVGKRHQSRGREIPVHQENEPLSGLGKKAQMHRESVDGPVVDHQGMAAVAFVNPAQSVVGVLYLGLVRRRHFRLRAMQLTPHGLPEKPGRSRRVKREPAGEIPHARLHGSRGRDGAQALQHGYLLYAALTQRVGRGMIGVGLHRFRRKDGATHVQREASIRACTKLSQLSPETFSTIRPATTNIRLLYRHCARGGPAGLEESKAVVELIAREWGLVPEEIMPG